MTEMPLLGCRILIVEDDFYQARDIQQSLELAGAQIVAAQAEAPDLVGLLAQGRIDGGLIDVNLGHCLSFEFARTLRQHKIPFVFLTGYHASVVPDDLADAPCLRKPVPARRIVEELSNITAEPS